MGSTCEEHRPSNGVRSPTRCARRSSRTCPEINDIKDAELRAKVIEGWAFSLAGSSYQRISDMPGEGNPDVLVLKRGNQSDHLRGVAHFAMKLVEEFETSHPEVRVDRDIVLAGALCHDIGKPYEFDPVNRKRWAEDPSRAGDPVPAPFGLRRACLPRRSGCRRRSRISRSAIRSKASTSGFRPSATSCAMPTTPGGTSPARSACSSPRRWSMSAR